MTPKPYACKGIGGKAQASAARRVRRAADGDELSTDFVLVHGSWCGGCDCCDVRRLRGSFKATL